MRSVTTRMPLHTCVCGCPIDAVTPAPAGRTTPETQPTDDGRSLTLCVRCGRLYRIGASFALEALAIVDVPEPFRSEVRRIQRLIQARRPS